MNGIRERIKSLPAKRLNLVIDIWTSRQHSSVMGINCQYVFNGKITQDVLGFKSFDSKHSGVNIRDLLKEFMRDNLQIGISEVGDKLNL